MAENGLSQIGGRLPERLKGTDCKSVGYAYVGSNPTPPTVRLPPHFLPAFEIHDRAGVSLSGGDRIWSGGVDASGVMRSTDCLAPGYEECGCSSMVEQQPSKLNTRVRFPSPAFPRHCCCSSVGRALPCQGRCREFESRHPLSP